MYIDIFIKYCNIRYNKVIIMTMKEDIKKNEDSIKKLNVRITRIYDIVNQIQCLINNGG